MKVQRVMLMLSGSDSGCQPLHAAQECGWKQSEANGFHEIHYISVPFISSG